DNENFIEELKESVSSKKNKKQKDRNEQILHIMNSLKLNKFKGTQIKGYGNLVYEEIMNYLELTSFIIDLQKKNSKSNYDLASITKMMILTRILEQ
ncbi:transposase, partial [Mycoplasmopsis synoviae]